MEHRARKDAEERERAAALNASAVQPPPPRREGVVLSLEASYALAWEAHWKHVIVDGFYGLAGDSEVVALADGSLSSVKKAANKGLTTEAEVEGDASVLQGIGTSRGRGAGPAKPFKDVLGEVISKYFETLVALYLHHCTIREHMLPSGGNGGKSGRTVQDRARRRNRKEKAAFADEAPWYCTCTGPSP